MKLSIILALLLAMALLIIFYLLTRLWRVQDQIAQIKNVLDDLQAGNLNRRALTRSSDLTSQICYGINEIAMENQSRLIRQKQTEQAYKRLMTGLSHDVKTPLASLVGYLEAVESNLVEGKEKDAYIHVAAMKAGHLRQFVESLFEWVKLDAGDQIFHFERLDLNELTRDIIAEWIPVFENNDFTYEIDIPENEYLTRVDPNAYTRILNNLFQNAVSHSNGDLIKIYAAETEQEAVFHIADNGKGIPAENIPYIFERLYQCDPSRMGEGNGLGLAIAKEFVTAHGGTIYASSVPGSGTEFVLTFPKTR